jgi:hypothetical protein
MWAHSGAWYFGTREPPTKYVRVGGSCAEICRLRQMEIRCQLVRSSFHNKIARESRKLNIPRPDSGALGQPVMTSFLSIPHYSPLLVLAVGLSTFVGLWGVGTTLLNVFHLRLPSPWEQVTAILLGIQALSLAVQVAGITEIASLPVLRGIWWVAIVIGISVLLVRTRFTPWTRSRLFSGPAVLPIAIVAAAILINALVAIAPSTKIDDLYYHMLMPSRIVSDGALRFYREPFLSAIWPQMVYQISAAPNHAMGYPDSTNVVSWALSATLLWFTWRIIRANANTLTWTAICVASLCVGIYPAVWHVTGSAYAMGDLAMAAAIVAFCLRERLLAVLPPAVFSAMFSIFLLSAATSKLSLVPICGVLLCAGLWRVVKSESPLVQRQVALAGALPWIIFYCPIVWWTWTHSGAPFGPILVGLKNIQWEKDIGEMPRFMIRNAALGYSPLIWFGAIGAIFAPGLEKSLRVFLGCLLSLQCLLIYWFFPYDVRYLTLHYGLFIVFAFLGPRAFQKWLDSAGVVFAAALVFLLPWLAIQFYYAKQFFSVSMGLESNSFYQRYVAFYSDYIKLDRLLSKDTVLLLLAPGFRISAVYAPRPVFFDVADLPPGKPVALITLQDAVPGDVVGNYKIGDEIYGNPRAVITAYRTPGRAPHIGSLKVVQLIATE